MRATADRGTFACAVCGCTTARRNAMQLYCPPCSAARDSARKTQWARDNPKPHDAVKQAQREARRKELGASASTDNRGGIFWLWDNEPDFAQALRVSMPYDQRFSKNALWSMGARQGHVYMRKEIVALRDQLAGRIAAHDGAWFEGKVWVDIFVEKPNARSDAINVIDFVCDAAKIAIGVDDRWFSIRRLDWAIVKEAPRMYVGLAQEVTEHHRACSYCGAVKPLTEFGKNRSVHLGHGRTCKPCSAFVRRRKTIDAA